MSGEHYCQGAKTIEVKNGFDKVIGGQCSRCLVVLYGVGDCAGDCGKKNAELRVLDGKGVRWCSEDCRKNTATRVRKGMPKPVVTT